LPELSGIEVLVLAKEIRSRLRGAYVNNVYSIGESQVVRLRQPGGEDSWVLVSPHFGAWVSAKVSERVETTPFTSSLRSEIVRAKIEGVSQVDLDRVYDFSLAAGEEHRHLILELMPPGNIIVTGGDGRILLSLREVRRGTRRVVKGAAYVPPVQRRASPLSISGPDVVGILGSEKTIGQALGRNLALPRKYVREVVARLSLTEDTPAAPEAARSEEIAAAINGLVEEAGNHPHPCLASTSEGEELFAVSPISGRVTRESDSLCTLCDEVLLPLVVREAQQRPASEGSKKEELETTLRALRKQEAGLLDEAARLRELAGKAAASNTPEEARLTLKAAGETLRAPEEAAPASIASLIYGRAKELERKSAEARNAADMISKRVSRQKEPAGTRITELRREKREWYERFRWFFTTGGKLAIGGRDAQSNSLLVRRHMDDNDTVYHADIFGSPFFVLKGGRQQTEDEIGEVAQATVSFSSAWKTGLSAADAFWVPPNQVKSSAPSGEYLAQGSFMIYGKKNILRRLLVELAIGVDESGRVVAGPERAIAARTRGYVVLTPHREKPSETAKKVVKELEPLGLRRGTSLDEVVRALPAGGGKIVRRKPGTTSSDKL
jgi:predicted ribosome quality control (RQC) complex YloA/Tae2 family protein